MRANEILTVARTQECKDALAQMKIPTDIAGRAVFISQVGPAGISFTHETREWHLSAKLVPVVFPAKPRQPKTHCPMKPESSDTRAAETKGPTDIDNLTDKELEVEMRDFRVELLRQEIAADLARPDHPFKYQHRTI